MKKWGWKICDDNYDDGGDFLVMMVVAVVKRRWIEFGNYHVQVPCSTLGVNM